MGEGAGDCHDRGSHSIESRLPDTHTACEGTSSFSSSETHWICRLSHHAARETEPEVCGLWLSPGLFSCGGTTRPLRGLGLHEEAASGQPILGEARQLFL
ncbi:Hypothetical predicted protein [Pelobates cultripes]|uniref:Uncharacterized protein n=1 Tax=Pelobates cultripes TaxID=61616 RepID=A0AAD1VIK1_PELCU|nr:Hypothetical predicted protein [Pelobates cultripes]